MITARAKIFKEIQAGTSSGTGVFFAGEPKTFGFKAGRLRPAPNELTQPQTKLEIVIPEYFFLATLKRLKAGRSNLKPRWKQ